MPTHAHAHPRGTGTREHGHGHGRGARACSSHGSRVAWRRQVLPGDVRWTPRSAVSLACAAAAVGLVAGLLGLGGGELMAPLLLAVGLLPQVASATSACMVLFTAASDVAHYLVEGVLRPDPGYGARTRTRACMHTCIPHCVRHVRGACIRRCCGPTPATWPPRGRSASARRSRGGCSLSPSSSGSRTPRSSPLRSAAPSSPASRCSSCRCVRAHARTRTPCMGILSRGWQIVWVYGMFYVYGMLLVQMAGQPIDWSVGDLCS